MHVLIAPNAFKNSVTAAVAAALISDGLRKSRLDCTCECFPVGDGGDGTVELIMHKCGGTACSIPVHDPLGSSINASMALIDDGHTCLIEMAAASGLRLLKPEALNPLQASSFGTGELIRAALDKGVRSITLAMGGSATVDGGCGILRALGVRFLGADNKSLQGLPESLAGLAAIDLSALDQRILSCNLTVLCDVDNRLLGEKGAAAVFGPQKGASEADVHKLEAALAQLTKVTLHQTGIDLSALPYGGTAGGAAAGLHAFLQAKLVNGIDYFLDITGFDEALQRSDILITGEGSIDEQTLHGKGPAGVALRAKKKGIPVIGLAGKVPLEASDALRECFDVLLSIGHEPCDLQTALVSTSANLVRTSRELGNLLSVTTFFTT